MTVGEHLEELRRRVIYALLGLAVGVAGVMVFSRPLLRLLRRPYETVMAAAGLHDRLHVFEVQSGILIFFRMGLLGGAVVASPWVFLQLWLFVSSGLRAHERRYVARAVPASAGLFCAGAAFFLFVVSLPLLRFFTAFNTWLGLRPVISFANYVRLVTNLMLVFGLCFQTPVLVFFLAKLGLVTLGQLHRARRYVIVGILVVAAVATSPSPVDQVLLAVPMWLLYELGVVLAYLSAKKKGPQA
jgi:sec-independent protein translocase protein TatC